MAVDWARAFEIGGTGFGTVFLVLIILAVILFLVGRGVKRINRDKDKVDSKVNSEQKED
jgi:Na+-transporting methylmalonyl-CoA/oxaloacetate decarboxylase gamma subunit